MKGLWYSVAINRCAMMLSITTFVPVTISAVSVDPSLLPNHADLRFCSAGRMVPFLDFHHCSAGKMGLLSVE